VAVLDYVGGSTLSQVLESGKAVDAQRVAQIAIDLFSILRELENHRHRHNDLQPTNLILEELSEENRRADAVAPLVRLVAIDLNSAGDSSRSDDCRLGDIHWVVTYLRKLVSRLLETPNETSDLEYRLASVLEEWSFVFAPEPTKQRPPSFDECIDSIRDAVRQVESPWRRPPQLKRFHDSYNAQSLVPWFVPYFLVDPNDEWLPAISTAGPQVITGMRGCGKTMLLRALQFHARAIMPNHSSEDVLHQLNNDRFIGLYASSTRLLDNLGAPATEALKAPYVKLFVQYAIEALQAIRHLREISRDVLVSSPTTGIRDSVASYIGGAEHIRVVTSESQLERELLKIMFRVRGGDKKVKLLDHPAIAFPALAEAITGTSDIWSGSTVLFLLDDVSTRYLAHTGIEKLMSALLFQNQQCAFKLTTEGQTLEEILCSPGQIESARIGRDYEVFDLASEVNRLLRGGGNRGVKFISKVLEYRAQYYPLHPQHDSPQAVLGTTSLESIARSIVEVSNTSAARKQAYFGMKALAGVCVGDIGDVISLYESILRKGAGKAYPITNEDQSEAFQDYCSSRLYDLNRKRSDLKDHALSFAEASHQLMMQSYRDLEAGHTKINRLRQYLRIYVRLTTGNTARQFQQLRELIDSGVFVLDGGTNRTKTRDSDPIQQFKLTYRKIFGLSSYIGLSERDRFELSGEDLADWRNVSIDLRHLPYEFSVALSL
jgi:hypothetical protein